MLPCRESVSLNIYVCINIYIYIYLHAVLSVLVDLSLHACLRVPQHEGMERYMPNSVSQKLHCISIVSVSIALAWAVASLWWTH